MAFKINKLYKKCNKYYLLQKILVIKKYCNTCVSLLNNNKNNKVKRIESNNNLLDYVGGMEMFPIKRIENIHQELNHYYLQVIAFQDEDSQYQDIVAKFSKNLTELDDIIEDMRKYNNNKNNPLINMNK